MPETIGQRLKRARENRRLTLEEAAEVTRIRLQYLQALEADDFSVMPSPVQARGFLRNYADYLGINLEQAIEELQNAAPQSDAPQEVVFDGEVSRPSTLAEPGLKVQGSTTEKDDQPAPRAARRKSKKPPARQETPPASTPDPEPASPSASVSTISDESLTLAKERPGSGVRALVDAAARAAATGWRVRFLRQKQPLEAQAALPESEAKAEAPIPAPPATLPERPLSSQEIFQALGRQLRQRRDILGLDLDEIERHIHVRAQFLAALEDGRMEDLPSPVQTRGMLSTYAAFLDLEVDALLLRFADALQAQHRERYPEKSVAQQRAQPNFPQRMPHLRMFIAGDLLFGVGMLILLIVFVTWGVLRVAKIRAERAVAQATAPSISEVLIGTPQETIAASATPIPVEDTPLPAVEGTLEIPTAAQIANVQVNIVAIERSYLRVLVDGKVAFDGRTVPGTLYPFEAEQNIEILTGNAAALRVIYNQRDLGMLGGFGQLAHYVYTVDQIIVPTPAASLTPTLTPFITPTPSLTPSPTPSPTASPAGDSL